VLLLALSSSALADNEITVWDADGAYEVNQERRTVLITSAGTFKVQATGDSQECEGLGFIRSITVAQDVIGTVNLHIAPEDPETFDHGACDVGWVDLSNATTGNIAELRVSAYLGQVDGEPAEEDTEATAITGWFGVSKGIEKDVYVETLAQGGSFTTPALNANLNVTGQGPHQGTITIYGFHAPRIINIAGTIEGSISLGSW
jgi:hypothetical protein